jgi:hypothetical protein
MSPRRRGRAARPARGTVSARYLRVVTFEPDGHESAVDAVLRSACLPALLGTDAVVDAWIGRHGSRELRTRLIASTWAETPDDEPPDVSIVTALASIGASNVSIGREQTLELAVHEQFDRPDPARILRLFRGRVREGQLDAYIADSRAGMLADAMVNDGLVAFALGADPPDAFVTVSVWTGWSAIEEATGGNTRRPIATRHQVRLTGFEVVHFEVLPDLAGRPISAAGRGDGAGNAESGAART